ncbi:hypothetical protein B2I21_36325 [Chryseobacterium mucoviscidosis]|nr:hypothetical protein B2I21_36325 [Chryseobacterium mucoviscidosis]
MTDSSIPQFRIIPQTNTCLWYAAARDEYLKGHPEQDLLHQGKFALEVPTELKNSFGEKGIYKVYAPLEDLELVK